MTQKTLAEAAKEILDASRGKNSEPRKTLDDKGTSSGTPIKGLFPVSTNTSSGGEERKTPENPDDTEIEDLGGEEVDTDVNDENPDASETISKSETKVNANATAGEARKKIATGNPETPGQEGNDDGVVDDLAPHYVRSEGLSTELKNQITEDLGALLLDEGLSDKFKTKALTIFEAAIVSRINQAQDELEIEFISQITEASETVKKDLTEKTNKYLTYVAEEWMKENEIAIEKSLRSELTEDFISGLRQLFVEHYIDIPESKVNVVEELTTEVSGLEAKLNIEIAKNVSLSEDVRVYQKNKAFTVEVEGLTDVQKDKMKSLAEGVEFTTEVEFSEKLKLLRENYFSTSESITEVNRNGLDDEVETKATDAPAKIVDPTVAAVARAISLNL